MRIALVTCSAFPALTASDLLLAEALERRGHEVSALPWNGGGNTEPSVEIAVLRSNWDYHSDLDRFLVWLDALHTAGVHLINDRELVRWNVNKRYLLDLASHGVAVPRTEPIEVINAATITSWFTATGRSEAVLKPAWGASGHLVERVTVTEVDTAVATIAADPDPRSYIIQEFVPEVTGGEKAMVFFGGQYSHSFVRIPQAGEFRVNSGYGGTVAESEASPAQVDFGSEVLATLPSTPTYARIDFVATTTGPVLMELELNEPSLCLHLGSGSADRFAEAILATT